MGRVLGGEFWPRTARTLTDFLGWGWIYNVWVFWIFMVSWVIFGLGVLVGVVVGYFIRRKFVHGRARINTDKDLKLKGIERKVYGILDEGDGVGYFAKISEEHGIDRVLLGEAVKGLVRKGLVKDRVFSYRRKLCLVDYLNARERRVLDFVGKKGEADVSLIMRKCGVDDHVLIPMGKKFVRMGLIVKVRRGYKTFFVLTRR